MKRYTAIQNFLEAYEKGLLPSDNEVLDNLAHALRPRQNPGREANELRLACTLAMREFNTVRRIADIFQRSEREIHKFQKRAKERGWQVVNVSLPSRQVWVSGVLEKGFVILAFEFSSDGRKFKYWRLA